MLDSITGHVLDLLAADPRLIQGGNAFAAGFTGVKRVSNGDSPAQGYVNIFDTPYTGDSDERRPAIYVGTQGSESTDQLNFPSVGSVRIEHRIIDLPLVVCARGATRLDANKQRNQLRANIRYILLDHLIESGYWYQQTVPGNRGGNLQQRQYASATGASEQGAIEAACIIPIEILYSFSQGGVTA